MSHISSLKSLLLSSAFMVCAGGSSLLTSCSDKKDVAVPVVEQVQTPQQQQPVAPVQAPLVEQLKPHERFLTDGEKTLLTSIFGEQLKLDKVKFALVTDQQVSASPSAYTTVVYDPTSYSLDFSHEKDARRFASLFRSGVVLWQMQNGVKPDPTGDQNYELDQQSFCSYEPAQQIAIMEDYALRFLHESRKTVWISYSYNDDFESEDYLIGLVEKTFPDAKGARTANNGVHDMPLTENERAFIRFIFQDQIDLNIVVKSFYPQRYGTENGTVLAHVSDTKKLRMWEKASYSDNYGTEKDIEKFGTFIHEVTHIWQNQKRIPCGGGGDYLYPLENGKYKFRDYGAEQQAAMVEDYACYILRPEAKLNWLPQAYAKNVMKQKIAELCDVIEGEFPHLKASRLEVERLRQTDKKKDYFISVGL